MEQLQNYKIQKNRILQTYDTILKSDFLSIDTSKQNEINEKKEQFIEEKFIVSFCGQINSGKSTLINSLIFGKEILPSDPTPHTAKISFCYFSEEPYYEVVFYSEDEWFKIKNSYKDKDRLSEFETDINKSIENGVYDAEFINNQSKKIKEIDFSKMPKYVAASDKGGIYTPYVNYINVYYPSEILKDIIIVDTPGTNDPNVIRSKITEDWITRSNAVVYVTYANAAFDSADIAFIDNYLLGVSQDLKIFAVNKVDAVSNIVEVEDWIKENKNDQKLKDREIFNDNNSIVLCSALGCMISKMILNDEILDSNMAFYKDKFEESGYLNSDKNRINELESFIEKKIVYQKGKNLIESNINYLASVCESNIREVTKGIESREYTIENIQKDNTQLNAEIDKINDKIRNSDSSFNKLKHEVSNEKNKIVASIREQFFSIKKEIKKEIIKRIREKANNQKILLNSIPWIIKNVFEEKLFISSNSFVIPDVQKSIQAIVDKFEDEFKSYKIIINRMEILGSVFFERIKKIVDNDFSAQKLNELRKKYTNIFQRIFNTKGGTEKIIQNFESSEIEEFFKNSIENNFVKKIRDNIYIELDTFSSQVETDVKSLLENMKSSLENLTKGVQEKDIIINNLIAEIKSMKLKSKDIEFLKKEVLRG